MQQPLASSSPAISLHLYENEILGETERLLAETNTSASTWSEPAKPSGPWRFYPLLFLVVCGAAFALAQIDVKETLLSGRSVAQTPSR